MLSPLKLLREVETVKIQLKLAAGMILATIFAFTIIPNSVSAEQPAAEQYRQMFKSGNFYVEYQMFKEIDAPVLGHYKYNSANIVLAGKDGKRMMRETSTGGIFSVSISRTSFGGIFDNNELETAYTSNYNKRIFKPHMSNKKNYPDVLYSNGKYYRFIDPANGVVGPFSFLGGKKEYSAIVLPEDQLNSPNLDENEEWDFVREDLRECQ